jgi:hypothetical protein
VIEQFRWSPREPCTVRSVGDSGPYWFQDSNAIVPSSERVLIDFFGGGVDRTTAIRDGMCMRIRILGRDRCL